MRLPTIDEIDRELARRSLYDFLLLAWEHIPDEGGTKLVLNWHIKVLCDEIQALATGKAGKRNLCLNVPPGSMKSTILSVCLPAWMWLHTPRWTSLFISGAEDVAMRDSMKCRGLITSEWYRGFGISWRLAADQDAKGWFKNSLGGERQATTIGSRGTGKRVHFIGIDDPNETKEVSEAKLQAVWDAYALTFQNRLKDMRTGATCLIQQRTHMQDLTGRIMEIDAESWTHVVIRQRFEVGDEQKHPMDPRTDDGELLFPERFPADVVAREERLLLAFGFAGQHQQRPIPREGGSWKPSRILIEDTAPLGLAECRGWDAGATEGGGDYTVGAKIGRDKDGAYWILDMVRKQTGEPRALAKQTAQMDGQRTVISWPQDPGQAGKDQAQSMTRDFAGWIFKTSPESGAKRTRWEPFQVQVNAGNVRMIRAPWNRALIDEMETDGQVHDDQLDALARAFKEVSVYADPWFDEMRKKREERTKSSD